VAHRDGAMLHLLKMWLEAPVEEDRRAGKEASNDPEQGRGERHAARRADLPLLSNLYMRRFVLGWKIAGPRGVSRRSHRQLRR
jgi:RNA-directed DNA polymerase